jgi:hypothetical protein
MKTLRLWFPYGRTECIRVPEWFSREECKREASKYLAEMWEECNA